MLTLRRAIQNKVRVRTKYTPVRPGVVGVRILEPHALGYSKNGEALLRAWVHSGVSRTNPLGNAAANARWRLFRVDQMANLRPTAQTFETRPLYNYDGDRAMVNIVERVPRDPPERPRTRQQTRVRQPERPQTRQQTRGQQPPERPLTRVRRE